MKKRLLSLVLLLGLPFAVVSACLAQNSPAATNSQVTSVLRVKTDTGDVEVWLDGEKVGRTPLTLRTVGVGKHRLALTKDAYEDHFQEIEVLPSQTNSVFVVMKPREVALPPLPAEFKVIHQHRLGKCTGVLTVSTDFLDFKAVDDTDSFHIPIASIKSVARSWGSVAGLAPIGIGGPTDLMAFRIETPGRSYGFLAFKDTVDDPMKVASEKTRELYYLVFKLWSATLKKEKNTP
jgi:hypothetical protein